MIRLWACLCALLFLGPFGGLVRAGSDSPDVFVQTGHNGLISYAQTPDGRYILTGGENGLIKAWDATTAREIRSYRHHGAAVWSLAGSPDGQWVVSGSADRTAKVWELRTGKVATTFTGHREAVRCVALSPDGRLVLSGSDDFTAKIWEALTGRVVLAVETGRFVRAAAFSPDGRHILTGGPDGMALWDASDGRPVRRFDLPGETVNSIAFSPDGRTVLTGPRPVLWDVDTGRMLKSFGPKAGGLFGGAALSPDGRLAAFAGAGDTLVRLLEIESGREIARFPAGLVSQVGFGPDGRKIFAAAGVLWAWDAADGSRAAYAPRSATPQSAAAVGAGGALAGYDDGRVRTWDLETGDLRRSDGRFAFQAAAVAVLDQGRLGLAGGLSGELALFEMETGREIWRAESTGDGIQTIAVSPDGRFALTGHQSGAIRRWDAVTGRLLWETEGAADGFSPVMDAVIAPDSRTAVTVGRDGFIRVRDALSGEETGAFDLGHAGFSALALSPEGGRLFTGGQGGAIQIRDAASGRTIGEIPRGEAGHLSDVACLAAGADGKRLLSGSIDGSIRLWDLESGRSTARFEHKGPVVSVEFLPGEERFVSAGWDGAVKVWDIRKSEEMVRMMALPRDQWVTMTPEGYYRSSAGGHEDVRVRVGFEVYGIDQFYDVFYRPDIVESKLKGQDISGLIRLTLEDALRQPPPGVETWARSVPGGEKAVVSYRIRNAGGGIGEVRVFHNGKLIKSDGYYPAAPRSGAADGGSHGLLERTRRAGGREASTGGPPKGDVFEETVEAALVHGENEFGVCAFNAGNTVQSAPAVTKVTGEAAPGEPRLFILAVGVDDYADASANLRFAVKDALDVTEALSRAGRGLFKPGNIQATILTDAEAAKERIFEAVRSLAAVVKPLDMVAVFFAGHGVLLENQYYFVTHEYDGRLGEQCLIGANDFVDMSRNLAAMSQIFLFDSCHAGGVDYVVKGLYDSRLAVMAKKLGLHVLASCESYQEALDGYRGNGLFSHGLLTGLRGQGRADADGDRRVTAKELGTYVKRLIADISHGLGRSQTPTAVHFGRDISLLGPAGEGAAP